MQLAFKEIKLQRISENDIELLRKWRNSDFIRSKMFFQEHITQQMQKDWFHMLSLENDFYFLILFKQKPIGVINLKNIDWQKNEGEAGLYIADSEYRNTHLTVFASLAFLQYFFEEKAMNNIYATVRKDNTDTLKYNKSIGFESFEGDSYILKKERYFAFTKGLIQKVLG